MTMLIMIMKLNFIQAGKTGNRLNLVLVAMKRIYENIVLYHKRRLEKFIYAQMQPQFSFGQCRI